MSVDTELTSKLNRRKDLNDALAKGENVEKRFVSKNLSVHHEFPDFDINDLQIYEAKFNAYNTSGTGKLNIEEFKLMMEKLGAPQTHVSLKAMIKEVDEDQDGMITFREFMSIFRKFAAGELVDSNLEYLAKQFEIDVDVVGVKGAKSFFEAKISAVRRDSQFEQQMQLLKEEKLIAEENKRMREQKFKARAAVFEKTNK